MNDIRARFEEIWPVPRSLYWDDVAGSYRPHRYHDASVSVCAEYAARLDTFTRCQETTSDIERALAGMLFAFDDGVGREWSEDILDYARKLVSAKEYVK